MNWDRYNDAIRLDGAGKKEEALSALKSLVAKDEYPEDNATILLAMASILRTMKRAKEALEAVNQALALITRRSRVYPPAIFVGAALDIDRGEWKRGLKMLNFLKYAFPAYLEEPEHKDLLEEVERHRGIALCELAAYSDALPLLKAAAGRDYAKDSSLHYLGRCLYALGKMHDSKHAFQELLKLGPNPTYEASAHNYLAMIYYSQRQYAWARQEFEWCLDHIGPIRVKRIDILTSLVNASRALGMDADAQIYSDMLRHS